jgi:hypothetical protein
MIRADTVSMNHPACVSKTVPTVRYIALLGFAIKFVRRPEDKVRSAYECRFLPKLAVVEPTARSREAAFRLVMPGRENGRSLKASDGQTEFCKEDKFAIFD